MSMKEEKIKLNGLVVNGLTLSVCFYAKLFETIFGDQLTYFLS